MHSGSRRPGAGKDSEHAGLWRAPRPHRRQLRPRQSPLRADRRRVQLGIRQRQPSPLLRRRLQDRRLRNRRATGLATAGQRCRPHGRRLPDPQDSQGFQELAFLGLVSKPKHVRFFGAQATGCSPISDRVKRRSDALQPQKPNTIARSLAIGTPADGPYAAAHDPRIRRLGGGHLRPGDHRSHQAARRDRRHLCGDRWRRHHRRHRQLIPQGRIAPDETTVVCITGNGLKTTDALSRPLRPPRHPRHTPAPGRLRRAAAFARRRI